MIPGRARHRARAWCIAGALAAARATRGCTVIVTELDPAIGVPSYGSWWDVPIAETSPSEPVREARRAYEAARAKERRFL